MSDIFHSLLTSASLAVLALALIRLAWIKREQRLQLQISSLALEVKQLRDQLKQQDISKRIFFERLNYELRTPLNSLVGAASLATNESDGDERQKHMIAIRRASDELAGYIEEIFDAKSIAADAFALNPIRFSLREQFQKQFGTFSATARDVGVATSIEISKEVPDSYRGDISRLTRGITALSNQLLTFTTIASTIAVSVRLVSEDSDSATLAILVSGRRLKLKVEDLESIYATEQCFSIAPKTDFPFLARPFVIALENLSLLNAKIELATPTKGRLVFALKIRLGKTLTSPSSEALPALDGDIEEKTYSRLSISVLLVEDDPLNGIVAQRLLEQLGCVVHTATSGEDALRLYQTGNFDAILMDRELPGIDGLQLTAIIRRIQNEIGCKAPIIALTAHVSQAERMRCLEAGMSDFLSKPLSREALYQALHRIPRQAKRRRAVYAEVPFLLETGNKTLC